MSHGFDGNRPARQGNRPRASNLDNLVVAQNFADGVDFVLAAGQFYDNVFAGDVDDLRAENIHDAHQVCAGLFVGFDFNHDEFAFNRRRLAQIDDFNHVD